MIDFASVPGERRFEYGPSLYVFRISTVDGRSEDILVLEEDIITGRVELPVVARREGQALVEFPQEAFSGAWRAWVST